MKSWQTFDVNIVEQFIMKTCAITPNLCEFKMGFPARVIPHMTFLCKKWYVFFIVYLGLQYPVYAGGPGNKNERLQQIN